MIDPSPYRGPILVTLATLLVYYGFISHVARTKFRLVAEYRARGERFDRYLGGDREMLAADRVHLNMLEQLPPFLVLLWLNAVFVGTWSATVVGSIYVASRLLYPFVLGRQLKGGIPGGILASTLPGYAVMLWFLVALGVALT